MKFLVIDPREPELHESTHALVDFLWDMGHEVHLRSYFSAEEFQKVKEQSDVVIVVIKGQVEFENHQNPICECCLAEILKIKN